MILSSLQKKKIPDAPGVYFFLGPKKEILYIGKATSLKTRTASYFTKDITEKRSKTIALMVEKARSLDYTVTDSVLEALILEANLIRTHKPKYNTLLKDDKSYNHLIITNENFPRVLVVRGRDITEKYKDEEILYHFGPFTNGSLFREALKVVQKLFMYYDTKAPVGEEKTKIEKGQINFNRQIGLYPEEGNKKLYLQTIRHIKLLFQGKKKIILKELHKEMMQKAEEEAFEEAASLKKKIFALQHIQDISLIKDESRIHCDEHSVRIEAYDIAHLSGKDMVGVMTVVQGGIPDKSQYRKFKIQSVSGSNDPAALKEVIERRLGHEQWPQPQIIVVDGGTAQKNAAEHILRKHSVSIPVVAVVKDEKHNPVRLLAAKKLIDQHEHAILLANAESHRFAINYHKQRRSKSFLSR
jgi:excinuclease UvrABC nuclease subunit